MFCFTCVFFFTFFFMLFVLKTVEHCKYEMPYVLITLTTILSRTNFKVMYLNGKGFGKKDNVFVFQCFYLDKCSCI